MLRRPTWPACRLHDVLPLLLVLLVGAASATSASAQGWQASAATNAQEPPKRALLIVSGPAGGTTPGQAQQAAEAYRALLLDLGFDTLLLGPASRPALDQQIRQAGAGIPGGAWLAVLVLGGSIAQPEDIFIVPADASPGLGPASPGLSTEAVRLSFVLRRLADTGAAHIVALADDCQGLAEGGVLTPPDGAPAVSVACIARTLARGGEREVAAAVTGAMTTEGLAFEPFVNSLRNGLRPPQAWVIATAALSPVFSFFPRDHFQQVETACRRIDPDAGETQARNPGLAQTLRDCEAMVARYPYVSIFRDRAAAGREQVAFQRSTADCAAATQPGNYLDTYPAGRYARAADDFRRRCAAQAQPAPAQVPSGVASIWRHNASLVGLIADGDRRVFVYVTPREGLTVQGAKPGTRLFEGVRNGSIYRGTAFRFHRDCGAIGYPVSGEVSPEQTRVVLQGLAPRRGADCAIRGHEPDQLVFEYVSRQ